MNVYEAAIKVVADMTQAKKQIGQEADKAADAAGQSSGGKFSGKFGTALKATIGGAIGAGLGVVSSMMLQGAAELNAATSKYAADTGATIEETAAAGKSIQTLFRSNLQSMGQIGDTLAVLRTDMGLTGDEADKAADKFLKYATATGQDAAGAVSAFDDILDSWGLTAKDAAGVMDVLVVSHQKFGGEIAANQTTLAALAPAMKAANMEIGDGAALLNLFGAKGIDANTASAAFAKSLTKVKSPEELQTLIDQISATEDPFTRAQLAADLFGAKAGAKLANALAGANLDDYKISLEEAAGASDRAGAAIENSFGNQFTLLLHNAGGALAGLGSNFGPLIIGFASLLPILTPILTTAGAALGGVLAAAIPIGMALLPVLLIAALVAAVAFLIKNPEILAKVADFAGGIVSGIMDFLSALPGRILGLFGRIFDTIIDEGPGFVVKLAFTILTLPGKILPLVGKAIGIFADLFGKVLGAIPGFIGSVVTWFLSIPGKVASIGFDIVKGIINGLASLPGRIMDSIARAFRDIHIDIGPFHISSSGVTIDLPHIDLPHFATGAWNLPADTLAVLHKGEMVVPAEAAERIRTGFVSASAEQPVQGGNTYVVQVQGLLRARTADEIGQNLRRLAAFGVLPGAGESAL